MYHHGVDSVRAFVLAGGKSSRMGPNQDKALFRISGRNLLEHALELAKASVGSTPENTWIVGSPEKFAGFGPVVADVYPGQGPLAGIHAALSVSATDLNLIIAVDMPFLQPKFLSYLIGQARDSSAAVVVPRTAKGLQPLAAVYRREFAAVAERALRAGQNKVALSFAEIKTRVIEVEELEQNGFGDELFRNLNTGQEWLEAQQKLSAQ
jgi:molybdenum cofactor guanylyltransferase